MNDLISIVVPVYNVQKYLENCIESIIGQTYTSIEIILVDDGSTDKSSSICDKYAEIDSRIKVIHKENGGLSSARNAGLKQSSGKYVGFVDSDDYIDSTMYEKMLISMKEDDSQICCCGRKIVKDKDVIRYEYTAENNACLNNKDAINQLLLGTYIDVAAWDKLYVKSLFDDIEFPEGEINEDLPIMARLFSKCNKISYIKNPFYNYRITPGSITNSGYKPQSQVIVKHLKDFIDYISTSYPELNKSLDVFKGSSGLAMCTQMLLNKRTIDDFPEDYAFYRKLLVDNKLAYILCKNKKLTLKIKYILLVSNIYPFVKKIKDLIS